MPQIPTAEECRREAYRLLGDAADYLHGDYRDAPLSPERAAAFREAREAIAAAKAALNRAAR